MRLSEALGTSFRIFRHRQNMSQTDVAALADVGRSFVSDVENGRRNISVNTFLKLCDGINTDPRLVLDESLKRMGR